MGDQFFTDTTFTTNQHGRITMGHLGNHIVDRLHLVRASDDVRRAKSIFQFFLQTNVFFHQTTLIVLHVLPKPYCLRNHGCNDGEQANVFVESYVGIEQLIRELRENDALRERVRNATRD